MSRVHDLHTVHSANTAYFHSGIVEEPTFNGVPNNSQMTIVAANA